MLARMGGKSLLFEYLYAHHWWSSLDLKEFRFVAVTTSSYKSCLVGLLVVGIEAGRAETGR